MHNIADRGLEQVFVVGKTRRTVIEDCSPTMTRFKALLLLSDHLIVGLIVNF